MAPRVNQLNAPLPTTPNHGTAPVSMLAALKGLGLSRELYASPFDYSELPTHYNSLYPEDQLFGASPDTYNSVWSGVSYATPPRDA